MSICEYCENYIVDASGVMRCDKANYKYDAYGDHKMGALCKHDELLISYFKPISDKTILDAANIIERNNKKITEMRDRVSELERRLTLINDE